MIIPEKCATCSLSLEELVDCIDCLRIKRGLCMLDRKIIEKIKT